MANYKAVDTDFTSVANAIRDKAGITNQLVWPAGFKTAIEGISSAKLAAKENGPAGVVSVNDAAAMPAKQITIAIEPVQNMNGYDAPWPSGGSRNMIDSSKLVSGGINDKNGNIGVNAARVTTEMISVVSGSTYIVSIESGKKFVAWHGYDQNASNAGVNMFTNPFTVPDGIAFVRIAFGYTDDSNISPSDVEQAQLELGNVATDYVPYANLCPVTGWKKISLSHGGEAQSNPDQQEISMPDEIGTTYGDAGTVYGGTLTINEDGTAILTVTKAWFPVTTEKIEANDHGYHTATQSAWIRNLNYYQGISRTRYGNENPKGYCPCSFAEKVVLNNSSISSSQYRTSFKGAWTTFEEFAAVIADMEENGITPHYVARLETPLTYTLTAEQVIMLLGNNTVWADSGDVTLDYYTEDFTDLAELIGYAEGGDY